MNHATGKDRVRKPLSGLLNGGLLRFDSGDQVAAAAQVFSAGRH